MKERFACFGKIYVDDNNGTLFYGAKRAQSEQALLLMLGLSLRDNILFKISF